MNIAFEIKKYLEERGIKQSFLAERINLNPGSLNRTLLGKRSLRADEYLAICAVLNKAPDYFSRTSIETRED